MKIKKLNEAYEDLPLSDFDSYEGLNKDWDVMTQLLNNRIDEIRTSIQKLQPVIEEGNSQVFTAASIGVTEMKNLYVQLEKIENELDKMCQEYDENGTVYIRKDRARF